MRIRDLNVGVDSVSRLRVGEDAELPREGRLRPAFMPTPPELDDVLRRPSLDERLPSLLQPAVLDSELLDPSALSRVREETRNLLAGQARAEQGMRKKILESAAANLSNAMNLDDEVRRALAALLKG
jgi:hypothetical protein